MGNFFEGMVVLTAPSSQLYAYAIFGFLTPVFANHVVELVDSDQVELKITLSIFLEQLFDHSGVGIQRLLLHLLSSKIFAAICCHFARILAPITPSAKCCSISSIFCQTYVRHSEI